MHDDQTTAEWQAIEGDCVEVMDGMAESSVDDIVADPPYGLEFMGKEWDRLLRKDRATGYPSCRHAHGPDEYQGGEAAQAWHQRWAEAALRVLKPGGHLLAFGGTRTFHRLACALEDAGFEIRDTLMWLYGQGFPKSLDVSKAIDKAAGAERPTVRMTDPSNPRESAKGHWREGGTHRTGALPVTAPATDAARQWSGWGTALKPAWEPIILARKPLSERTVAANVQRWGTGGLNIDACRLPMSATDANRIECMTGFGRDGFPRRPTPTYQSNQEDSLMPTRDSSAHERGRWPANLCLDAEAAAMLDQQTGERPSGGDPLHRHSDKFHNAYRNWVADRHCIVRRGPSIGGASRFFYVAKASRTERNAGLEGVPVRDWHPELAPLPQRKDRPNRPNQNTHPTVKPIALMRWLVRLVTPPGGTVLDPFMGSGSTGCACVQEGFNFVGIEQDPDYCQIARRRIAHWAKADIDPLQEGQPVEAGDGLTQLSLLAQGPAVTSDK